MIVTRYIARHVFKGTALVLLILVFLSLFFNLIRELNHVGQGDYGLPQLFMVLALRAPNLVVEFMPLAVLLGCILSLGALAANSELIALQSSGLSVRRLTAQVGLSVLLLAMVSLVIADMVVPHSEGAAKQLKSSSMASNISIQSRYGMWIKDGDNIIFIEHLYPNGAARNVEIYYLDKFRHVERVLHAENAFTRNGEWILQQVNATLFEGDRTRVEKTDESIYQGNLSERLLGSLTVDPRQMSTLDLYRYINFLHRNSLDFAPVALSFWRKLYSPLSILAMGLLAIPFVLGSQRHSNTGQRIMLGIMLGLAYVVLDRLLIQMGEQLGVIPVFNALLPTLCFLLAALWLIRRKSAS